MDLEHLSLRTCVQAERAVPVACSCTARVSSLSPGVAFRAPQRTEGFLKGRNRKVVCVSIAYVFFPPGIVKHTHTHTHTHTHNSDRTM